MARALIWPKPANESAYIIPARQGLALDEVAFFGISPYPSDATDLGTVFIARGDSVTQHSTLPPGLSPAFFIGIDADSLHVMASGPGELILLRWRSGTWAELARFPESQSFAFHGFAATGPDEFWVSGYDLRTSATGTKPLVARWTGTALEPLDDPALDSVGISYEQVVPVSADEVWFAGATVDHVLRWTRAGGLERIEIPGVISRSLAAVGDELFLLMDDGLHRWNGTDFGQIVLQPRQSPDWVGGRSKSSVWLYEHSNCNDSFPSDIVRRWDGSGVTEFTSGYCSLGEPFVVGTAKRAYVWDGTGVWVTP